MAKGVRCESGSVTDATYNTESHGLRHIHEASSDAAERTLGSSGDDQMSV